MEIKELAEKFRSIKKRHAEVKAELARVDEEWTEIEQKIMDWMIEEGQKSVTYAGIGRLTMATKNYLSVTADHKPLFFEYLKESGNGDLLKLDVHPKTLGSFLDQHFQNITSQLESSGLDQVTAREQALEFLNSKGASFFSKKHITLKEEA